jgi:hypothetical protein
LEPFYQRAGSADDHDYNLAILSNQTAFYLARNYTAIGVHYEIILMPSGCLMMMILQAY